MAAPKEGTREKLLDVAEQVFAVSGFEGASLRTITRKARVTVGSVNYHFKTKHKLFEAVIRRRFEMLATERLAQLADARGAAQRGRPSVEAVIQALVQPFLAKCMQGGTGWRNYSLILVRHMHSRFWYERLLSDLYDPGAKTFMAALHECLPDADDKDIGYAFHFLLGAMIQCCADLEARRLDRLTEGVCAAANFNEILPRLVRYCTAGTLAIVKRGA